MRVVLVAVTAVLLLQCESVVSQEEEEPPKRMGRKKKKNVEGEIFAPFGLSPEASSPHRLVEFSEAEVMAASSAASSSSTSSSSTASARKVSSSSGEPSAPGTQAKVDMRPYMSKVENQARSNSCAANAVAGAYEYLAIRAALRDGDTPGEISRLFIYYVGRKRDQVRRGENTSVQPKDEGMTLGGAIEAVQIKGAALQATWPFNLDKINSRPHNDAFGEAIQYKVGAAMSVPVDLDSMRQCLSSGYPIVFGLKLTASFFRPPRDGFVPTPDPSDPKSAEHGLHAMLLVGYNDRQRVFIVRNSWGENWGAGGYAYLSYDYVANKAFNFCGMYAIQSLTDDDLTPDDDDGADPDHFDEEAPPDLDGLEDFEDDLEPDEPDDFDADDMFDSVSEARRAFRRFSGDDDLSKLELSIALKLSGASMVTSEEIDMAFARYDDDRSGSISLNEFLDMQELFDGSLLERHRMLNKLKLLLRKWARSTVDFVTMISAIAACFFAYYAIKKFARRKSSKKKRH